MAVTKTALILVQLACVSFAWENLPQIPANRRAEYYLQHDDGAYKYGYDTGEGQSAQATADSANQVKGGWQYINNEGQRVNWGYTAGQEGYVPVLRSSVGGAAVKTQTTGQQVRGGSHVAAHASQVHSTGVQGVSRGDAQPDADYDENADASYHFAIDTDSYKRQETSDSKGNIQGQYSYNSPVGGKHAITYKAGEELGFVVLSESHDDGVSAGQRVSVSGSQQQAYLSPAQTHSASATNGQTVINPDGSFAFSYTTSDQSREEAADAKNNVRGSYSFKSKDDGKTRRVNYHAGAATGFVATGDHLPVAPKVPVVGQSAGQDSWSTKQSWQSAGQSASGVQPKWEASNTKSVVNPDGSYAFSYTTGDQSRQETGDAQNNVQGSYSWTGEGATRKVDYTAGAATGFVATSDHLPVATAVPAVPVTSSVWDTKVAQPSWSSKTPASESSWSAQGAGSAGQVSNGGSVDDLDNGDGSYSYSYKTDTSSKQETADAQGNVVGSFTFLDGAGVNRQLTYSSQGDAGFVASGTHLPVAPVAGAIPATGASGASGSVWAAKTGSTGASWSGNTGAVKSAADSSNTQSNDGSYSYSYSTDDQSVQQSSDANNNVQGSFSSKAKDDGKTRTVNWIAGADTGFVAQGDHLPVASVAGAVPAVASAASWSSKTGPAGASWNSGAAAVPSSGAWSGKVADTSSGSQANDGSYSYSYSTGDQSVQQSADANNNVKGSYSFKAIDDGQTRRVDYTAGAATGFVATGAHLPVAPVAGAVPLVASVPSWSSKTGSTGSSWNSGIQVAPSTWSSNAAGFNTGSQSNDGSYSYSYSTDDQSVQQSADANNNVKGSYSFKALDDGQTRRVDYTAGAATGFVATGAHLPVAPVAGAVPSTVSVPSWSSKASQSGSSWSSVAPVVPASGAWSASKSADSSSGSQSNDGSYSHSYSTGDQSVQQSADAHNNARGSYSFKAKDDGETRTVNWKAGADTGFVAQGDHLPVAPVAGAVPSVVSGSSWSTKTGSSGSSWNAGSAGVKTVPSWSTQAGNSGAAKSSTGSQSNDGSYSYSYSTDTQSVQQSSDANNNVAGSYSFKAKDDGKTRTVNWKAGADTGFVAQGDHLPVAPALGSLESRLRGLPAASPGIKGINARPSGPGGVLSLGAVSHTKVNADNGDGSYSYSYQTDSSSKDESADAQGNVKGTYTYVGSDGLSRKLSYTARGEEGFIATGDHLPVAPSVGSIASQVSGAGLRQGALPVLHSGVSVLNRAHASAGAGSQSHAHAHSHGQETRDGNVVITKYSPPDSHHKFGYIFDTKQ